MCIRDSTHSEYNKNQNKEVRFLQIWIFPKERNIAPRYDQVSLKDYTIENELYQVVSPNKEDQGAWINQDAWFYLGDFNKEKSINYQIQKEGNGVYIFVLEGTIEIGSNKLEKRDGIGIWDTNTFHIKASHATNILLMEVPMGI